MTSVLETEVRAAADLGFAYISRCISRDGVWRDFATLAGPSSDWITGVVVASNPGLCAGCRETTSVTLIRDRHPDGGWGYSPLTPSDCDSTAWVLLALASLGEARPSLVQGGAAYLLEHFDAAEGGFRTYVPADRIAPFVGAAVPDAVGWQRCHPCVSGVAIQALLRCGVSRNHAALLSASHYLWRQLEDGLWTSYWWRGIGYATYHAVRALRMLGRLGPHDLGEVSDAVAKLANTDGGWSSTSQSSDAFETALCVMTLLGHRDQGAVDAALHGINWLVEHQAAAGNWAPVPVLRIPPPVVGEPETVDDWGTDEFGTGVFVSDQRSLFVTSVTVRALRLYLAQFGA